jgi:hypothetical protein
MLYVVTEVGRRSVNDLAIDICQLLEKKKSSKPNAFEGGGGEEEDEEEEEARVTVQS